MTDRARRETGAEAPREPAIKGGLSSFAEATRARRPGRRRQEAELLDFAQAVAKGSRRLRNEAESRREESSTKLHIIDDKLVPLEPDKSKRIYSLKLAYGYDDNLAEEADHYLTERFLAAAAAPLVEPKPALPARAPEIYAKRQVCPKLGRKENPIEFLERVWGDFIAQEIVYQGDIKRLGDPDLVRAVRGRCRDTGVDPRDVLPPPGKARSDKQVSGLSLTPEQEEAVYLSVARKKTQALRATPR